MARGLMVCSPVPAACFNTDMCPASLLPTISIIDYNEPQTAPLVHTVDFWAHKWQHTDYKPVFEPAENTAA